MNNRKISVSLSSFCYWFDSLPAMHRLDSSLCRLLASSAAPAGFEFNVSFNCLNEWSARLFSAERILPACYMYIPKSTQRKILECKLNTIHLEPLRILPAGKEKWLLEKLLIIYETMGISEFTVHPDGVSKVAWENIHCLVPAGIDLSIENMDYRKDSFQSLDEIEALLTEFDKFRFTFDVCHWLELGHEVDSEEVREFFKRNSHRLSKIHFSVPKSEARCYKSGDLHKMCHYLCAESGIEILDKLAHSVPENLLWVTEGVVPPNNFEIFEKELALLRGEAQERLKVAC